MKNLLQLAGLYFVLLDVSAGLSFGSQTGSDPGLFIVPTPNVTTRTHEIKQGIFNDSSESKVVLKFPEPEGRLSVCRTEHCYNIARAMTKAMNTSANPCDDFYEYACGNWTSYNPIPDDRTSWDNFQVVSRKVTKQLREVLEHDDPNDLSTARRKAKVMYRACLDIDRMSALGIRPLIDILQTTMNGWPLLSSNWTAASIDWLSFLIQTKNHSSGFLFPWGVGADSENPKENTIHFSEISLGLGSRKYYLSNTSESVRLAYKDFMRNLIIALKNDSGNISPDELVSVQHDADAIYEFETFLAQISRSEEDGRNVSLSLNKMTLEQFYTRCLINSSLSFENFMDYMTAVMPNSTFKALITKDLIVNVRNPEYIMTVQSLIREYLKDPMRKRVLVNFVGWRIATSFSTAMTPKLREISQAYTRLVGGSAKEPERWELCANVANGALDNAVGSLYVKKYFNESSKVKIVSLVKDLRNSFSNLLAAADWMDETTRTRAYGKLASMNEYIAYADYIVEDVPRLDREYENFELGPDHMQNYINLAIFNLEKNLRKLLKNNTRSLDDDVTPTSVNAFNYMTKNTIALAAGILQFPFYEPSRPEYLNYAGIGFVIGHEITHGFDDMGSVFDADGRYFDWWSPESRTRFKEKTQGVINKYGRYTLPEGPVNGILTQGENIADCGGIKEAFNAYQLYSRRKGVVESLLPGFEGNTTEQMFFIGFSQVWCGSQREKTRKLSLLTGSHSPNKFRVIGSLSSMPQFADAYHCPLGSRMNPRVNAGVW